MNTRVRTVLLLAAVLPCWYAGAVSASAFARLETGRAYALLVNVNGAHEPALAALAQTLGTHYGVAPAAITHVRGSEATSDRVESALFEHGQRLQPHDQLFVVLALDLHAKGEDRIMVTADFSPAQPWSGLPTRALRKVAAVNSAGTIVIFYPECSSPDYRFNAMMQSVVKQAGGSDGASTLIGFCGVTPAATDTFLRDLAAALTEAARKPTTRAPWQGSGEKGLVGVTDIADRLAVLDRDRQLAVETGAGGGWLRVFGVGNEVDSATVLPDLRAADTTTKVLAALQAIVTTVRDPGGAASADAAAAALTDFALDDAVDAQWRVLTVQAAFGSRVSYFWER